jgi:hypothetical protein
LLPLYDYKKCLNDQRFSVLKSWVIREEVRRRDIRGNQGRGEEEGYQR